jgi:hypothetical protein
MMINEMTAIFNSTIVNVGHYIASSSPSPWISLLAFFGLMFLIQTILKSGIDMIYIFAYIYGFIKWRRKKVR